MDIKTSDIFKQRDFSELISDTVNFYIRNAKPLFKYVFNYLVIFLIIKSIFGHYYSSFISFDYNYYLNFFETLRYGPNEQIAYVLILKTIDLLLYTMLITVVGVYFKISAKKGTVEKKDLNSEVKSTFFKIFGSNILILFVLLLAFGLVIPGIYLFVAFSLVPFIIIFEDLSVGKAMKRSIHMIKGSWWKSFGAFLVISLIYFILTLIISLVFPRLFMFFGFVPFVFALSSLLSGVLYCLAAVLPVLLIGTLYSSYAWKEETPFFSKKEKQYRQEKDKKAKSTNLHNQDKEKNRFLDNNESDRFKPKH